jgi:hypothetical protein
MKEKEVALLREPHIDLCKGDTGPERFLDGG